MQIGAPQGRDAGIVNIRGIMVPMVPRMMLFIVAVGSQVKLVQPSIPTVSGYILTLL